MSTQKTTSGRRAVWVPFALTLGLFLLSWLPRVQANPVVAQSVWGATTGLLLWQAALFLRWKHAPAGPVASPHLLLRGPRAQHYVQAMCQLSVYAYWGWYWPPVYDFAPLLVAQLVFAYAFDMLLSWTRRGSYVLGFGPFPIIFSTNLFLWFKDDWFYLQFVLVAVGFMGKEFVRWQREGRNVHIFNPSAFSLGLFSLALIATNTTHLTWGPEIAATLSLAPHIYVVLFLIGLVVMYFFSVTLVAASAAAVLFGSSALYASLTGVPYFLDSEIPSAVFLGLHLLVTDPSTSPRTPLGRLVFGVLYGLGVFGLYSLLGALGAPTFYDKLLCVPLLNLSVPWIDRAVRSIGHGAVLSRLRLDGPLGRGNLAHMAVWMVFFGTMTVMGRTDGRHPGDSLPFWVQACEAGRPNACKRLLQIEASYCGDNSGWACNELGAHYTAGTITPADARIALAYFSRACELRFQAGCVNLLNTGRVSQTVPRVFDLRLLVREGGLNLLEMPEPELYARACGHGWTFACER
jgi:Na+-translocating ferredoxin:NAD+ oxidoreductase RnfD subunit